MHDSLYCGKRYRALNIVDDYNRESPGIEIDFSLPSQRVMHSLEPIIQWRRKPGVLRYDNGPEYISPAFLAWVAKRHIRIGHIQPGYPQQNAYIERYNVFDSLEDFQDYATQWMWFYNNERPNMATGGIPPGCKLELPSTSKSR